MGKNICPKVAHRSLLSMGVGFGLPSIKAKFFSGALFLPGLPFPAFFPRGCGGAVLLASLELDRSFSFRVMAAVGKVAVSNF